MRVNNVLSGRPAYYDRNPLLNLTAAYSAAAVAPHAQVQRTSYTVPSGKKTIVALVNMSVLKTTVSTATGKGRAIMQSAGNFLYLAQIFALAAGTSDHAYGAAQLLLIAGNSCQILTDDAATGGSNDYDGVIQGFEFDA